MISKAFKHRVQLASALAVLAFGGIAEDAMANPPGTAGGPALAPLRPVAGAQAGEEASTRFNRGLQLFDEGDYALALVEFERAYQLAPNYRALYNIGLVNVQLGRYADATRTFDRYLRDGGEEITPQRKVEVANALSELKLRTATVDVSSSVPFADVSLDGKPIDPTLFHGPTLIDAGEHTFRATASGFRPASQTVTLAGGDAASVRLQLVGLSPSLAPEPPRDRGPHLFVPGVVATGILAAGGIASSAILLAARARLSTLQNTAGSSESQRTGAANEANAAAAAADIFTGLAIAAGGVSIYLSLRVDHSPRAPSGAIVPQQIVLSGTF
jgi:tetratricopeptide (TPR) repeat protein